MKNGTNKMLLFFAAIAAFYVSGCRPGPAIEEGKEGDKSGQDPVAESPDGKMHYSGVWQVKDQRPSFPSFAT